MKKNEKLLDAMSGTDGRLIDEAYNRNTPKKNRSGIFEIIGIAASVAAIAVFAVVLSHYAHKDGNISASSGNNISTTETTDNSEISEIMFMTPEKLTNVTKIRVTDWSEKKAYEIEGEGVKKLTDHLASLCMMDLAPNDTFLATMSSDINMELLYSDGTVKEFYVIRFAGIYDYDNNMVYTTVNSDDIKRLDEIIKDLKDKKDISDTAINTTDDEKIKEKFLSLLKANGTTDGVGYYKYDGIKSIDNYNVIHYCLLEKQIPDTYIISEGTKRFIMVNDMIFKPVGGGFDTFYISMCDYNNDGVIDISISICGGSGMAYTYGYTIDMTEMKIVDQHSDNPYYNFHPEDSTETTETTDNIKTSDIVFMTSKELTNVTKIHVTSLPEGYDYSFAGEEVKPITDYLASLHPVSIDDNDGYIDGMTWVIELTYADGTLKEIYHIGNTYIHRSDGNKKYYKLTYEEASKFGSVIGSGENRTENAEIELVYISQIREINGYSYFESEAEDEWKSAVSGMKLRDVRKIISVAQCMPSLLPKDYLVLNVGMEGSVYSAENAHSISCTFIDGIDTDQDGNFINNGTYSSLSVFLYKKEAYEGSEYISKLADKYQIKGSLSADSIYEKYSGDEITCTFMIETDAYYVLYEYRGYEGGKRNLSSKNLYEIAASAPYIKENGYTPTEITVTKPVTETDKYAGLFPDDFSFTIVWGTYGISSYDSKTGVLIKSKDATDISRYTTTYKASNEVLFKIYELLFDNIKINSYPDEYDPFNSPDAETRISSSPNQTIIISVTAYGEEKTVRCENICFGSKGYDERATQFLEAEFAIVDFLTCTDEWQALPEYEVFYN